MVGMEMPVRFFIMEKGEELRGNQNPTRRGEQEIKMSDN